MYEICLAKQNVLGCEVRLKFRKLRQFEIELTKLQEALMYLSNAVRDFESLISSINIEVDWENSEKCDMRICELKCGRSSFVVVHKR